jgi:hypothetical protein
MSRGENSAMSNKAGMPRSYEAFRTSRLYAAIRRPIRPRSSSLILFALLRQSTMRLKICG